MGAKKGRKITWELNAGRKKVDVEKKSTSKSLTLPNEKWEKLDKISKKQKTTRNKIIVGLIDEFLEYNKK